MEDQFETVLLIAPHPLAEVAEVLFITNGNTDRIADVLDGLRTEGKTPTAVYVHSSMIKFVSESLLRLPVYPSLVVREDEIRIVF